MFGEPRVETSSPNMGEGREGEAAFRCETIIARFPHPNPPPSWGRGNDAPLSTGHLASSRRDKEFRVRNIQEAR
jgi:hypothetical protein